MIDDWAVLPGQGLYCNFDADPQELRNQYDNPVYAGEVAKLKQRLEELRGQYADNSDIAEMPDDWKLKVRQGR